MQSYLRQVEQMPPNPKRCTGRLAPPVSFGRWALHIGL